MNWHTEAGSPGVQASREDNLLARPAEGSGMTDQIDVQFEAGPSAAAGARNALRALDGRVDRALLDDVRLLVSELVTNSVRHSNVGARDIVRMTVGVTERTLRVDVMDPGPGFEPSPRDADRTRPGGWGLYLVDQLSDRWGVVRDRFTRVWFELDQHRNGVAA
jgi:anti-sigma regulatory factor (Ser/Thr protein kinase)